MNFFLKYWSPIVATLAFLLSLWASYNTYKLTHLKPKALIKWINEVKTVKPVNLTFVLVYLTVHPNLYLLRRSG